MLHPISYDPDQQLAQQSQEAECSDAEPRPQARKPYAPKHRLHGTELTPQPVCVPAPSQKGQASRGAKAGSSGGWPTAQPVVTIVGSPQAKAEEPWGGHMLTGGT